MRVLLPDGVTAAADPILEILKKYKTIAVVGLSSNPARPSFGVTEYMQSGGIQNYSGESERDGSAGREELRAAGGCAGKD